MTTNSIVFVACLLMTVSVVKCNYRQDLINGVRASIGTAANTNHLLGGYHDTSNTFVYDLLSHQVDDHIRLTKEGERDPTTMRVKLTALDLMKDIKYARKAMKVSQTNLVDSATGSATYMAIIAYRENDRYVSVSGWGHSYALMVIQHNVVIEKRFRAELLAFPLLFAFMPSHEEIKKYIPRGFTPVELNDVRATLIHRAVNTLYHKMCQVYGLQSIMTGLGASYIPHAEALKRMYGDVSFEGLNLDGIPEAMAGEAVRHFSQGMISNPAIIGRITQLSSSAPRCSFLYVPSPNRIYLISIQKQTDGYYTQITTFSVSGSLPVGAFASSVGAWNIESTGTPANPSVHDLLKVLPPLK